jgi:hypothetical protein
MKKNYSLKNGRKNPYAKELKQQGKVKIIVHETIAHRKVEKAT